jgi:hypothetical protein
MSRRRRWRYNFETRSIERVERDCRVPIIPRTPEARRRDIASRCGVDESWVVLGEKPHTWKLIAPDEQRRALMERKRIETAKWYGVPVSSVWTEVELAKWRAARAASSPIDRILTVIRSHAQSSLVFCLKIVPIFVLRMGRN